MRRQAHPGFTPAFVKEVFSPMLSFLQETSVTNFAVVVTNAEASLTVASFVKACSLIGKLMVGTKIIDLKSARERLNSLTQLPPGFGLMLDAALELAKKIQNFPALWIKQLIRDGQQAALIGLEASARACIPKSAEAYLRGCEVLNKFDVDKWGDQTLSHDNISDAKTLTLAYTQLSGLCKDADFLEFFSPAAGEAFKTAASKANSFVQSLLEKLKETKAGANEKYTEFLPVLEAAKSTCSFEEVEHFWKVGNPDQFGKRVQEGAATLSEGRSVFFFVGRCCRC